VLQFKEWPTTTGVASRHPLARDKDCANNIPYLIVKLSRNLHLHLIRIIHMLFQVRYFLCLGHQHYSFICYSQVRTGIRTCTWINILLCVISLFIVIVQTRDIDRPGIF